MNLKRRLDNQWRWQWDLAAEAELLNAVSRERLGDWVRFFAATPRESGSAGERSAADRVVQELRESGIRSELHQPEILLSLPRAGRLEILAPVQGSLPCRPMSFSAAAEVRGRLYRPGQSLGPAPEDGIALLLGLCVPARVRDLERAGARAQIWVHPDDSIHEGNASWMWGPPTPQHKSERPATPIVCVTRASGERLDALLERGPVEVAVTAELDERWAACPLPVARIDGMDPCFLLLHGHLDCWFAAVGDNGTGDAALLELCRLLGTQRGRLARSLRVAFWPGHAQGRFAGATWYADSYATELDQSCVAHVNVNSPGCRGTSDFCDGAVWMVEGDALCKDVVSQVTGQPARGSRPARAGDWAFDQIGVTGLHMTLSMIPAEVRKRQGLFPVKACGGDSRIWHTAGDGLEVCDLDALVRDTRIYAATVWRVLQATILPFDYSQTARELHETIASYRDAARGIVDLSEPAALAAELHAELRTAYAEIDAVLDGGLVNPLDPEAVGINESLLRLARQLVPVNYARGERFDHDLALARPPVPRLAGASGLAALEIDARRPLCVELVRESNKVSAVLRAALCETRELRRRLRR